MISFRFDGVEYAREPELTSVSLFQCQYYCTRLPWEGRWLFSPHSVLFYVAEGRMTLTGEEGEYTIGEGCFFLLDGNRRYRMSCDKALSAYRIAFSCTSSHFLEAFAVRRAFSGSLTMAHRILRLYHDFQSGRMIERCEVILLEILMELSQPDADIGESGQLYQRFCRYCDAHLCEGLDAETVSAALGCHRDHLNRVIKRFCGRSFRDYVVAVRLEAAQTLLLHTEMSIAQIAQEVGFSTTELFIKFFRYHAKTTPSRYRDCARE